MYLAIYIWLKGAMRSYYDDIYLAVNMRLSFKVRVLVKGNFMHKIACLLTIYNYQLGLLSVVKNWEVKTYFHATC